MKLAKKEKLETWGSYDIEGTIDSLIEKLNDVKKQYGSKGYSDFTIDMEDEWGYYDEHNINFVVYGIKNVSAKEFVDGKKQCIKVK